jgi:type VII secretion-associated serine protease mycosin
MRLADVAGTGQNERAVRRFIDGCRSAFIAFLLATLTALGAGLLTAQPAHADSVRNEQWQLGALNAEAAWEFSTGRGITVAILDSGVDASHPDLAGQVLPGIDLVDGTTIDGRSDPVGHGTTVAALIAGNRDNDGVVGIAPDAKILPVRVLDKQNRYDDAVVVAKGVRWAVDHGAQVINLSLGGITQSDQLASALGYAADHDVVVIACTGNIAQTTGTDLRVWYPAREPGVVAVTGLRNTSTTTAPPNWLARPAGDQLWSGSLTGAETVLSAPAANLVGARPGGYWKVQGTSFAAPLVTATAALIRARAPTLNAANVINHLIATATDLGPAGRDDRYGYGLVDPVAAVTKNLPEVAENPLTDVGSLSQPATGHRTQPGAQPEGGTPAGAGNQATDPASPATDPVTRAASQSTRVGPLALAGIAGPPLLILALLMAAAIADKRGYLTRYQNRPRHSRS